MACVKDEQEALKLDENFKQTLLRIKPHFLTLASASERRVCKLWLDKLHASTGQRRLRNLYLYKMHQQLRNNKLNGVFEKEPPDGPLISQGKVNNQKKYENDFYFQEIFM